MHHHACHEARIQRPTTPRELTQTRLDELVVQLGRSDGEDGRGKVGRGEPMCEDMHRHEDEGCIGGDAQRAREFAWLLGGGCDESPGNTRRDVYDERRQEEILFSEWGLVVLPPQELLVM